jgi:acyl-CoA thioester hydrolase
MATTVTDVFDFPSTRPGGWDDPAAEPIPAPLALHEVTVGPEWVDYNGHMSEWCYLLVMGDSSDAFFRYVGIDDDYRDSGRSLYTVETHIRNLDEVDEGERLLLTLRVLGVDAKRVHIAHEVLVSNAEEDVPPTLVATGEQLLLHVESVLGKVTPIPPELHSRLVRMAAAHAASPVPAWVGRPMGLKRTEG